MTSATPALGDGREPGPAADDHAGHQHDDHQHDDHQHGGHRHDGHQHDEVPPFAGPVYATPVYAPPGKVARFFTRLYTRAPKWSAPVAVAVCFAGAAGLVLVSNPTDGGANEVPGCLIKLTTGLDCPGCGGTRAFYYLMTTNVPEAMRHHAMAVFAAPFLVWAYLAWAIKKTTGRALPMPQFGSKTIAAFIAAWAAFTVIRNIPVAPFTSLYV